jgi:prophage regulatory protein
MRVKRNKENILRLPDVKERTGLSKSTIYAYIESGDFPKAISLGIRCKGWVESQIDAWIEARIRHSDEVIMK